MDFDKMENRLTEIFKKKTNEKVSNSSIGILLDWGG